MRSLLINGGRKVYYPINNEKVNEENMVKENLAIQLYGKRIYEGQTVGEYLLEFLLVFLGANGGKGGFDINHDPKHNVAYSTNPNIGLKRFIFFENSKAENKHNIDRHASKAINELVLSQIVSDKYSSDHILYLIKDLFYGFSMITNKRSWFAQGMMPLCEELVFCEAQNKPSRKSYKYYIEDNINKRIDTDFEFTKHSFMGRGGEVYYMHILQGVQNIRDIKGNLEAEMITRDIEQGIHDLLSSFPQFKQLSEHIQNVWEKYLKSNMESEGINKDDENDWIKKHHKRDMACEWIKASYCTYAKYSIDEIRHILSTSISELEKLELLNIGVILQLFRLMINEAYSLSQDEKHSMPIWLIQIPATDTVDDKVKKMAVKYYNTIENYMITALAKQLEKKYEYKPNMEEDQHTLPDNNECIKELKAAYKNSHKLLRKIGKDIGLIIPISGQNMRFTISDDLLKYFVLSMIEPDSSITLDSFLSKLYEYYGIVIREDEYIRHYKMLDNSDVYAPCLSKNLEEFILQLRKNGFLKELSDATAIVINPYERENKK